MRITIRVRPGSTRPGIGGNLDGALVVRVAPRASDGKATEAALAAVAKAFGLRRDAVSLVTGATSRTKIIQLTGADPAVLQRLLSPPSPPDPQDAQSPPDPQDPPNPQDPPDAQDPPT